MDRSRRYFLGLMGEVAVAIVVACGGKVVFTQGSGGAGGSGGSSYNGTTTGGGSTYGTSGGGSTYGTSGGGSTYGSSGNGSTYGNNSYDSPNPYGGAHAWLEGAPYHPVSGGGIDLDLVESLTTG